MPYRKVPLVNGRVYHILNKSIAGYEIFNSYDNKERMLKAIIYYTLKNVPSKLSRFLKDKSDSFLIDVINFVKSEAEKNVEIIAWCLMPTHYHLILKQLKDNGIVDFATSIQKGYTEFFNLKHNRKGPLWEGRFKSILVDKDEYLIHLTRYIHLNPVTAGLVDDPKDWQFSSYREYLNLIPEDEKICDFSSVLDIDNSYEKFVKDRIGYQRELANIKHLLLE